MRFEVGQIVILHDRYTKTVDKVVKVSNTSIVLEKCQHKFRLDGFIKSGAFIVGHIEPATPERIERVAQENRILGLQHFFTHLDWSEIKDREFLEAVYKLHKEYLAKGNG